MGTTLNFVYVATLQIRKPWERRFSYRLSQQTQVSDYRPSFYTGFKAHTFMIVAACGQVCTFRTNAWTIKCMWKACEGCPQCDGKCLLCFVVAKLCAIASLNNSLLHPVGLLDPNLADSQSSEREKMANNAGKCMQIAMLRSACL